MADNDYILGEASSDQYLNLQPLRVGDNATMLAWGVDSPGIRYQEDDEYAVQVVIPISPNGYAANVPPIGTTEILSFSSGNCSSKITEPTGSGPSSTRSQIAREYARVDCETHQYLQILKARTAKYREEKATTRIAFNKELWKLEDKAADARVETWRNDVAVFQEMVRMRKEKVASDALLRAEVHRLRGENEALVRQLKLEKRKTDRLARAAETERAAAEAEAGAGAGSSRPRRTCKSKYRRD